MDTKGLEKLLAEMNGKEVDVGWFESNRYEDGTQVAAVAACNELGEGNIPARPFMRKAFDDGSATVVERFHKDASMLITGKLTIDQVLGRVGMHYEAAIVESIKNGGWQPNAPITIKRKGFDKPLIETGIMWQSPTHVIS